MKLNIGCGPNVSIADGWVNYDYVDMAPYLEMLRNYSSSPENLAPSQQKIYHHLREGGRVDFRQHDLTAGFPMHADGSVDGIYLGQVIEHLNRVYAVPQLLSECRRILRPGGVVRITTPDLGVLIAAYLAGKMSAFDAEQPEFYRNADGSSQLAYIMYGASGPNCTRANYEGHMFLYTTRSMTEALVEAGFTPPFDFHWKAGSSRDATMASEVLDEGMSHSFVTEASK